MVVLACLYHCRNCGRQTVKWYEARCLTCRKEAA